MDSTLSHMIGALEMSVLIYYYIKSTALCGKSPEPGQRNVNFVVVVFFVSYLCTYYTLPV